MTRHETTKRTYRQAAWAACVLACSTPAIAAAAQDARIEQIPAASPPREVPIARPDVRPPAQLSTGKRGDLPTQVSRPSEALSPVAQLSREAPSTSSAPQVFRGRRSAQSSTPLSSRGESKPGAMVRVAGKDRCDAAASDRPAACARVIETRSAQFTRANPLTLSAEQRLLVDQRLRDLPSTADAMVRRIGRNEVDANSTDTQGVASVVLTPAPAVPTTPAAGTTAQTPLPGDAEVLSIIQALAGGTPVVTSPPQ